MYGNERLEREERKTKKNNERVLGMKGEESRRKRG